MKQERREKLYVQAFRSIRAYIIHEGLQPGDLLPTEQSLCDMLGVSRNVLREAIKAMELMGMAQAQPGRGTVLLPFKLDFVFQNVMFAAVGESDKIIKDMLDIRKKLELGYMQAAYQSLNDDDIKNIRSIFERIKAQWKQGNFIHADDRDFHMAIFSKLSHPTLLSLMDAIWSVDENFKTDEKRQHLEDSMQKHENIVRALEAHNKEAFEAAMLLHFASGKYSSSRGFEEF